MVATRQHRLSEFQQHSAPSDPVELLCEDHRGKFVLPFPCLWDDGKWVNVATGVNIEAAVIGWRVWVRNDE